MARKIKTKKITSTDKQKGASATRPAAAKREPGTTQGKKDNEGWGPIGTVAKKAAKGAVKGAAKEVLK